MISKLLTPKPFKERYRRIPPHLYEEVKNHLQEMVEVGAIRRSFSSWASAVVLVRKKDGGLRFCINLCKLNNRTVKDGYSLPRIRDTLDCLHGAVWFSMLDLKSGYWQVELEEEAKPLTAFPVGPLGFWECEHMPFGLTNAPATFQRLMQSFPGELHLDWCIIYLDDIIVFSWTYKEHLHRLKAVFNKLKAAGLKLKPSKFDLFKQQINYLGHVVSKEGFEHGYHAISDAHKNFSEQQVRAAITKSCVGDAADAMCCLPPGATLDDILEKFKWLYGSVESSDTLMQEFYHIAQGKSEKVQTFVLHLEWALKAIKQQCPYVMTKEEGHRHLKDHLFYGFKPNLSNALCYLYDKPDSQYSQ